MKSIIGKTYHLYAAKPRPEQKFPFFRHIGLIQKKYSDILFGIKPEEVVDVTCAVIEQDICVKDYCKTKNIHSINYFAMYDIQTGNISTIQPTVTMFDICFPCGADAECYRNGKQVKSIVRLKVEKND